MTENKKPEISVDKDSTKDTIINSIETVKGISKSVGKIVIPVAKTIGKVAKVAGKGVLLASTSPVSGDKKLRKFNGVKLGAILATAVAVPTTAYVTYMNKTEKSGDFIINNMSPNENAVDEYKIAGCYKTEENQAGCLDKDSTIMLVRPRQIQKGDLYGIPYWGYDDKIGRLPIQGECKLSSKGEYLLRGKFKPIVTKIEGCKNSTSKFIPQANPSNETSQKTTMNYTGHKMG